MRQNILAVPGLVTLMQPAPALSIPWGVLASPSLPPPRLEQEVTDGAARPCVHANLLAAAGTRAVETMGWKQQTSKVLWP